MHFSSLLVLNFGKSSPAINFWKIFQLPPPQPPMIDRGKFMSQEIEVVTQNLQLSFPKNSKINVQQLIFLKNQVLGDI